MRPNSLPHQCGRVWSQSERMDDDGDGEGSVRRSEVVWGELVAVSCDTARLSALSHITRARLFPLFSLAL